MIKEAYVSFETAKLLMDKGFNEPCYEWYNPFGSHYNSAFSFSNEDYKGVINKICAPTQQMAMRWLREVHHIFIWVSMKPATQLPYYYQIFDTTLKKKYILHIDSNLYGTYEMAIEAAIKYCLEHLI